MSRSCAVRDAGNLGVFAECEVGGKNGGWGVGSRKVYSTQRRC